MTFLMFFTRLIFYFTICKHSNINIVIFTVLLIASREFHCLCYDSGYPYQVAYWNSKVISPHYFLRLSVAHVDPTCHNYFNHSLQYFVKNNPCNRVVLAFVLNLSKRASTTQNIQHHFIMASTHPVICKYILLLCHDFYRLTIVFYSLILDIKNRLLHLFVCSFVSRLTACHGGNSLQLFYSG